MAILGNYQSNFKILSGKIKPVNNRTKLKGFVSRLWMGQPTEQSRDDFKDVQEVEVLSYKNFQKKFCGEAFFGMSSLKTQKIGVSNKNLRDSNKNLGSPIDSNDDNFFRDSTPDAITVKMVCIKQ